ncbi:MAG: PAS domain S-box protein [Desulfobacterales bacterium]|nr:PAS domain S-box protein [Desulfobacterales bacterium]
MVETLMDKIFEDIVETIREPLLVQDQNLRVVLSNLSFYEFFKVTPEETVGQLIYELGNKQWDIPKLRELLEIILPENNPFNNYEVEHDFATIGKRTMLLNARQIERAMGKELIILLAIEDITERNRIEEERNQLVIDLQRALANVKQLTGLLPICSHCKKIRDDKGYWNQIEVYINQHSEATFSHGICQECIKKYYPDLELYDD